MGQKAGRSVYRCNSLLVLVHRWRHCNADLITNVRHLVGCRETSSLHMICTTGSHENESMWLLLGTVEMYFAYERRIYWPQQQPDAVTWYIHLVVVV